MNMLHRDCEDVINLKILRWGDYSGLFSWTQCNYMGPCKKGNKRFSQRKPEDAFLLVLKMKEGSLSQGM